MEIWYKIGINEQMWSIALYSVDMITKYDENVMYFCNELIWW